jgi:hypothetical protein
MTAYTVPSYETRARTAVSPRYSAPTPRFETMLQSTRRDRGLEPSPFISAPGVVATFFARHFSTVSARRPLVYTTRWLAQRARFVSFDGGREVTPYAVGFARYRVQARVEARGRTNFVAKPTKMLVGSAVDARYLRAKSPRSRQYLLRLPSKILAAPKQEKLTRLLAFRGRSRANSNIFFKRQAAS